MQSVMSDATAPLRPHEQGPNFAAFHAGPFEELNRYTFDVPGRGIRAEGKLFLQKVLGLSGAEVSLNRFPAGRGVPWLHKHRNNEELFIFVGGRGQIQIDGTAFDVREGSVVRISPDGARSVRSNSDQDLWYICVQYRAGTEVGPETGDGAAAPGRVVWPS